MVLMGHSTGCQDVLHYLYRPNPHTKAPVFDPDLQQVKRLPIDGAIMQAAVSDREVIFWVLEKGIGGKSPSELRAVYEKLEALAKEAGHKDQVNDTMLPLELTTQLGYPSNTPISCRRFLSLVSPDSPRSPSEDDLFSSDLSDEQLRRTFGMIKERKLLNYKVMVLSSGADQAVPDWVNKENLLSRWKSIIPELWDHHSSVIPGASHALSNDDQAGPRKELVEKVLGFLDSAESVKKTSMSMQNKG